MFGQDFVVATLQKSIQAGKIAPAYLFSGPRGCGKTTSARLLAKSINCAEGPTGTPCGTCPACVEIARGASLDVIEIDGASNTSVNDVRQIKDEVLFPPNSCRYKVYIIDEVHMLSTSAFNALLKTIEEPPPYVVFIFATTELHKVPATIKSRCQQFNFRLVPVELLKDALAAAAAELGIEAEDEALYWIAREATGSPRDAYTLFDQVTAFSDGKITFDKIRDKLGLVGVDRINPLAEACVAGDSALAIETLDGILQSGVSVEQFTVDLAEYFRSLLFVKSGIVKEALLGQNPDRYSPAVLGAWGAPQLERALGMALQLFRDIRYSLDPRYELELTLSRLTGLGEYVSPAELKRAVAGARALLERGATGPFPEADRRTGDLPAARDSGLAGDTGRAEPDGNRSAGNGSPEAGDDEPVENPFAALKARMGLGKPVPAPRTERLPDREPAAPAQPYQAPAVAVSTVSPGPEPLPVEPAGAAVPSPFAAQGESPAPVAPESSGPVPEPSPVSPAGPAETASGRLGDPFADSPRIPFSELRDTLVSTFQSTKNMVATGLAQTFDWAEDGNRVRFSVDRPFMHNLLEQEHKLLATEASRLLGRRIELEIVMDDTGREEETGGSAAIPPEIEAVRHMFRGTLQ